MGAVARRRSLKGKWLTGHLTAFGRDPLGFLEGCAREYGDFVPLRFLNQPVLIINAEAGIEDVLTTRQRSFVKGRGTGNPFAARIFGKGLLTSEGPAWTRQRRLVQPAFHRKRVAGYAALIVDLAEAMIAKWKDGERRAIHGDMIQYTSRVISRTLFGTEVPAAIVALEKTSLEIMETMSAPPNLWSLLRALLPKPADRRITAVLDDLDSFLYGIIESRRKEKADHGDILSLLMEARDEQGQAMNDRELRDEMATLLVAGLDTTVLALSWACYLLARHPSVAEALENELSRVLQGRPAQFEALPSLPYTEAVIKETMRLFPPAWVMVREAIEDCVVGGHAVRKGTMVMLSPWLKHRDPRIFSNPEAFQPERWMEARDIPRFAYFPFGGGPRICVGHTFAMMEAPLALGTICQRFRFVCEPGYRVETWPSFTLQPRGGIHLEVRKVKGPVRAGEPGASSTAEGG
jgi:cytochrome P450